MYFLSISTVLYCAWFLEQFLIPGSLLSFLPGWWTTVRRTVWPLTAWPSSSGPRCCVLKQRPWTWPSTWSTRTKSWSWSWWSTRIFLAGRHRQHTVSVEGSQKNKSHSSFKRSTVLSEPVPAQSTIILLHPNLQTVGQKKLVNQTGDQKHSSTSFSWSHSDDGPPVLTLDLEHTWIQNTDPETEGAAGGKLWPQWLPPTSPTLQGRGRRNQTVALRTAPDLGLELEPEEDDEWMEASGNWLIYFFYKHMKISSVSLVNSRSDITVSQQINDLGRDPPVIFNLLWILMCFTVSLHLDQCLVTWPISFLPPAAGHLRPGLDLF